MVAPALLLASDVSALRIVGGAVMTAVMLASFAVGSTTATTEVPAPASEPEVWAAPPAAARVDLYGNEIEAAITEYHIDLRGELYERHAPQTALPEPKRPGA